MSVSQPHYFSAFERHESDAAFLENNVRLANADQLWGLATECGLKSLLRATGLLSLDQNGKPKDGYAVHVDELWRLLLKGSGNRAWQPYLANLQAHSQAHLQAHPTIGLPFDDWSVKQRYHEVVPSAEVVERHRDASALCRRMLARARIDGLREPRGKVTP